MPAFRLLVQAIGILVIALFLKGCEPRGDNDAQFHTLTIGRFYGFCQGSTRLAMYRLKHKGQLYKEAKPRYPSRESIYEGKFKQTQTDGKAQVGQLAATVPPAPLKETEHVLGCPDCAGQGGLYLGLKQGKEKYFCLLDNDTSALPGYLHEWVAHAHQAIDCLQD